MKPASSPGMFGKRLRLRNGILLFYMYKREHRTAKKPKSRFEVCFWNKNGLHGKKIDANQGSIDV
jgi:hypothetical protein